MYKYFMDSKPEAAYLGASTSRSLKTIIVQSQPHRHSYFPTVAPQRITRNVPAASLDR